VVAVGSNSSGQRNVAGWMDIVQVSAGYHYTVALRSDGTVVAVGSCDWRQCHVDDWVLI
jgi:alpha-tubulin suppressor-like RCC1 family protein